MSQLKPSATFQIGKNGVTDSSIQALEGLLENHNQVRISVIQASGRTRETMPDIANSISNKLKISCYLKIIGFTIILSRRGKGKKK